MQEELCNQLHICPGNCFLRDNCSLSRLASPSKPMELCQAVVCLGQSANKNIINSSYCYYYCEKFGWSSGLHEYPLSSAFIHPMPPSKMVILPACNIIHTISFISQSSLFCFVASLMFHDLTQSQKLPICFLGGRGALQEHHCSIWHRRNHWKHL